MAPLPDYVGLAGRGGVQLDPSRPRVRYDAAQVAVPGTGNAVDLVLARADRLEVLMVNRGAGNVWIGNDESEALTPTSGTGFLLKPGDRLILEAPDAIRAVAAAGAPATVHVIEEYRG